FFQPAENGLPVGTYGGRFLLPAGTDVCLFLLPAETDATFGIKKGIFATLVHIGGFTFSLKEKLELSLVELGCWSAVFDNVWTATELGTEAKGSLVLELEVWTLETYDAKPVVSDSEDLSLLSEETKSLDTELVSK
ncbi:hypothetical protein Tco_0233981, partial [Tanacetum coccineum]